MLATYQTLALAITNIVPWGLHITLSRTVAQTEAFALGVYRAAYIIAAVAGALGAVIYIAIMVSLSEISSLNLTLSTIVIASTIIPAGILNTIQMQIELGRRSLRNYNVVRATFSFFQLVQTAVAMFIFQISVNAALLIFALSAIQSVIVGYAFIRRGLPTQDDYRPNVFQMLKKSNKFGLTVLISSLLLQVDKLSAGFLYQPSIFGKYIVAAGLAQTIHIVGEGLAQIMFSRVAHIRNPGQDDWHAVAYRLRMSAALFLIIFVPATLFLVVVLPFLYGAGFEGAAPFLWVLVPAALLQSLSRSYEELIKALDGELRHLMVAILPAVIILSSSVVGSVFNSIWFLAGGVLLGQGVGLIIFVTIAKRLSGLSARSFCAVRWSDVATLAKTGLRPRA